MSSSAATLELFVCAMSLLQQGVAADMEGATDAALKLYLESCCRLDAVARCLPSEHASVTIRHAQGVRQRIEVLTQEVQRATQGTASFAQFPQFGITFTPQPHQLIYEEKFGPPQELLSRTFWLMRTLSTSMQTGAYFTPNLYVSKAVWLQDGSTTVVANIAAKVKYLTALCELLQKVQLLSHHMTDNLIAGLEAFLTSAEVHYKKYRAKEAVPKEGEGGQPPPVAQQQRSAFKRGVLELLHKGQNLLQSWKLQQDASYSSYLAWAVNVLEQAQIFERWAADETSSSTTSSSSSGVVTEQQRRLQATLTRIVSHLYKGVCSFLLRDMFVLLDRYLDKSRESFSRLLPVEIELCEVQQSAVATATPPRSPQLAEEGRRNDEDDEALPSDWNR